MMKRMDNAVILTEQEYAKLQQAAKGKKRNRLKSITAFLFVTTQVAALLWVSSSYGIALYGTVALGQVFPVESLSEQAVVSLLGVSFLKVLENVFEHNDGGIFGHSKKNDTQENKNEEEGSI